MKVNKKKVKVWGELFIVNSSSFSFQLPLQSNVQREIYDFTDIAKNNIADLVSTTPITQNLLLPSLQTGVVVDTKETSGANNIIPTNTSTGTAS